MNRALTSLVVLATVITTVASFHLEANAATNYNLRDLSPSIPHKSGARLDGVWNDGMNWFATNGTDSLMVDGKTSVVMNVTPRIQQLGGFDVKSAAGVSGNWLVAASSQGGTSSYYHNQLDTNSLILIELRAAGDRRVEIPALPSTANITPVLFRAGGSIYALMSDGVWNSTGPILYRLENGVLVRQTIPAWVLEETSNLRLIGNYLDSQEADGIRLTSVDLDGAIINNLSTVFEYRFNGTWTKHAFSEIPSAQRQTHQLVATNGYLLRDQNYGARQTDVSRAYHLVNARDLLDRASRRTDGTALLTGHGANGLRLVLALPINDPIQDEDEIGTLVLAQERVAGSPSKYILNVRAVGPVQYIRILKNGIGIAKCNTQTCRITVDVKGTADRFEAWAPSTQAVSFPLTSKAVILRDTSVIAESPVWSGNGQNGWSWGSPSSFDHAGTERMGWHAGASFTTLVSSWVCKAGLPCTYTKPTETKINEKLNELKSLGVDIFVEGKLVQHCGATIVDLKKTREQLAAGSQTNAQITDCSASITAQNGPSITTQKTYVYGNGTPYTYNVTQPEGNVRVYAKTSWTKDGKRYVTVSPTDVIHFNVQ